MRKEFDPASGDILMERSRIKALIETATDWQMNSKSRFVRFVAGRIVQRYEHRLDQTD